MAEPSQGQQAVNAVLAMEDRYIADRQAMQTLRNQLLLTKDALSLINNREAFLPRTGIYTDELLETMLMDHREWINNALYKLQYVFNDQSIEMQTKWQAYAAVADPLVD